MLAAIDTIMDEEVSGQGPASGIEHRHRRLVHRELDRAKQDLAQARHHGNDFGRRIADPEGRPGLDGSGGAGRRCLGYSLSQNSSTPAKSPPAARDGRASPRGHNLSDGVAIARTYRFAYLLIRRGS
jgi:hypothetical protein